MLTTEQIRQEVLNDELLIAARDGDAAWITALIGAGANVHSRGDLALQMACALGSTEAVKALIAGGADAADEIAMQAAYAKRAECAASLGNLCKTDLRRPPDRPRAPCLGFPG